MSIRSIQRITGLHQKTLLELLVLAGDRCRKLMNDLIKGVAVRDVEADEIWAFVGRKKMTKLHKEVTDPKVGDAYTSRNGIRDHKARLEFARLADHLMRFGCAATDRSPILE